MTRQRNDDLRTSRCIAAIYACKSTGEVGADVADAKSVQRQTEGALAFARGAGSSSPSTSTPTTQVARSER